MTEQWLSIKAQDVWMFRDSKPFTASQNFVAQSQFPPNPKTMQGVIRTFYLEGQGVDWKAYNSGRERQALYEAVGDARSLGELRLQGPFLAREKDGKIERIYRSPLDLQFNSLTKEYALLAPSRQAQFSTDIPFADWLPLLHKSGPKFKDAPEWITNTQMEAYLQGKLEGEWETLKQSDLFDVEDRIGLALDKQRHAAQESHFYRARFIRPAEETRLLLGVNLAVFQGKNQALRMGGESRQGIVNPVSYTPLPIVKQGRIKLILQTPAYFSAGWRPSNQDWSPWVGKARLVSFLVGKAQAISGWDMAANKPKALRHFIPAGSVFYFEDAELSGKAFTESVPDEPDFGAMGFGNYLAGTWNYLD